MSNNRENKSLRENLEGFGKSIYSHAFKSRSAKAALASVEYLDNVGVLKPLHAKELVNHIKPAN